MGCSFSMTKEEIQMNKMCRKKQKSDFSKLKEMVREEENKKAINEDVMGSPATKAGTPLQKPMRRKSTIRKSQCNGVVIVEDIKEYLPTNMTKDTIYQMVENALEGCIVDDESKAVQGKTVTRKQVNTISEIVYLKLKDEEEEEHQEKEDNEKKEKEEKESKDLSFNNPGTSNPENPVSKSSVVLPSLVPRMTRSTKSLLDSTGKEVQRKNKVRYSCINNLRVKVGMRDLTPELLKETCFKNKQVSEVQIDNAMRNLSQGVENVKVLTIELL